jgi:hypothetical protein
MITRDNSGSIANWSTSNPATASFTCSGSDRILFVGVFTNGTVTALSATYNGVSMTQLAFFTDANTPTGNKQAVFYMVNPPTGSNTVSVTRTGGANMSIIAASYNGVDQSNPIDAHVTDAGTGTAPSFTTSSVTVSNSDNWLVGLFRDVDNKVTSANILSFVASTSTVFEEVWDSNGAAGAGSKSVTYTISPTDGRLHGHTLISLNIASLASSPFLDLGGL